MKYFISLLFLLVLALLIYNWKALDSGAVSEQQEKIRSLEKIVKEASPKTANMSRETRSLKELFFRVNLEKSTKDSVGFLRLVRTALESENLEIKAEALEQTKSLLIQYAHQRLHVDTDLQSDLEDLFRTFKREGAEVIAEITAANPNSPTLILLSQL